MSDLSDIAEEADGTERERIRRRIMRKLGLVAHLRWAWRYRVI